MATKSIYTDDLAFDIWCEAMEVDTMPEPDNDLIASIEFREWLAMKGEIEKLRIELAQARNEIKMRPHANEWHRLHDDLERARTALEEIRDTIGPTPGPFGHPMLARFYLIACRALEPSCSRKS